MQQKQFNVEVDDKTETTENPPSPMYQKVQT